MSRIQDIFSMVSHTKIFYLLKDIKFWIIVAQWIISLYLIDYSNLDFFTIIVIVLIIYCDYIVLFYKK